MNNSSNDLGQFISLQKVSLRLHDRILFSDTDWEILKGQHWVVLGSNGSGKSTLIRTLCGKIPVIKGKILYSFLEDDKKSAKDYIEYVSFDEHGSVFRNAGSFYQSRWNSSASDNSLEVSEYLSEEWVNRINPYEILENRPNSDLFNRRHKEVIGLLSIESLMKKKIIQLSNGEMRKTMIAHALLRNPKLIVFDNPFAGLDHNFRIRMKEIMEQLMKTDICLMMVASRNEEIPTGFTHMLLVQGNRVVDQGTVKDVMKGNSAQQIYEDPVKKSMMLDISREIGNSESKKESHLILVKMKNVCVSYDDQEILKGIDWQIKKGENWALTGPNGSGKSTLLSLIFGDNPQAYANEIHLFGKRRGSGETIWDIKKQIGFVGPELHAYYPRRFSGFDIVCSGFFDSVGLFNQCSSKQKIRAARWMDLLGISSHGKRTFGSLSEGEQRIILLTRALVKSPRLLILDEPCENLDTYNRKGVLKIIEEIGGKLDTTIIYVTHIPHEIPNIITHHIVLEGGQAVKKSAIIRDIILRSA